MCCWDKSPGNFEEKMKPSCKKLREMIKDEKKGSMEYRKYNLPNLARDESKHSRILKNKLKRC